MVCVPASHVRLFATPMTCLRDFPGKNTGTSRSFLLQRLFPTQRLNPCLLYWQVGSLPLSLGSQENGAGEPIRK